MADPITLTYCPVCMRVPPNPKANACEYDGTGLVRTTKCPKCGHAVDLFMVMAVGLQQLKVCPQCGDPLKQRRSDAVPRGV